MKSFKQYLIEALAPTAIAKVRSTLPNLYRAHASTEDFIGTGAISPDTGLHHFTVFHNGGKPIQPREIGTHVSSKTFRDSPFREGRKRMQISSTTPNQPDDAILGLSSTFDRAEADRHFGSDRMITSKLDISVHPDNIRNFKDHEEWTNWLKTERDAYIKGNPKLSKYIGKLKSRIFHDNGKWPSALDKLMERIPEAFPLNKDLYTYGNLEGRSQYPSKLLPKSSPVWQAHSKAKRSDEKRHSTWRDLIRLETEHYARIDSAILKQNNIKAITLRTGTGMNRRSGEFMVLDPSIVDNTRQATGRYLAVRFVDDARSINSR